MAKVQEMVTKMQGYGVLPMAIRADTIVAIRRAGTKLVVANMNSESYPPKEYETDPKQVG